MNLQQSDFRCYFYNIFSLVPTLSAVYPGHNFILHSFNINFNIIIHSIPIYSMLPSSLGISYQNSVCICLSPMHNKFLVHLILQNLVILIMFPERKQLKTPSSSSFLQRLVTFFPLGPNVPSCTPLQTFSSYYRNFVMHYKKVYGYKHSFNHTKGICDDVTE